MNVRENLKRLTIEKRAYIDGRFVESADGGVMEKISSVDGTIIGGIAACDASDVDKAVAAAKRAYLCGVWADKSPADKKAVLLKLARLMEDNIEELALLDTYETGRAYRNYLCDSIPKAIEVVRYFAEAVDKYYDKMIPPRGKDFGLITRVPLGVVGAITPWNDPLVVDSWKFAPALMMGNSIVIKPAEQASLSLLKLAALTAEAGIPDGVFHVVTGFGEVVGRALAMHNDVRGIFFTGSSAVGKNILTYAGLSNMKKVALECGGKGAYIVTANCNRVAEAAKVLADNMFYNQGQICSAPSRVIADRKIFDEFMHRLKAECERYVPGDPFDTDNNVGCVVSFEQYHKIQQYIALAKSEGAQIHQAETHKQHSEKAACIQPTVISDISISSRVVAEEIFGPVVVVLPVDSTAEALSLANNSNYGLAGAVWTDDLDEACFVAEKLEAGLVHVNSYGNDDNSAPFGGIKESGLGKDKSVCSFDEYTDLKTIWIHRN